MGPQLARAGRMSRKLSYFTAEGGELKNAVFDALSGFLMGLMLAIPYYGWIVRL